MSAFEKWPKVTWANVYYLFYKLEINICIWSLCLICHLNFSAQTHLHLKKKKIAKSGKWKYLIKRWGNKPRICSSGWFLFEFSFGFAQVAFFVFLNWYPTFTNIQMHVTQNEDGLPKRWIISWGSLLIALPNALHSARNGRCVGLNWSAVSQVRNTNVKPVSSGYTLPKQRRTWLLFRDVQEQTH